MGLGFHVASIITSVLTFIVLILAFIGLISVIKFFVTRKARKKDKDKK